MMIELTTAALFLLGTFYNSPSTIAPEIKIAPAVREANRPVTLEIYTKEYFEETPILAEIARCESDFRHLSKDGGVLRGEKISEDIGIMQINEFYHNERAKKLGLDILLLDDNLAYAKWLYAKEGLTPWYSSEKCWQKYELLAKTRGAENIE